MAKGIKETDIQGSICDYLALKRYFFWRTNTTPIFDSRRKAFRAMPKYARKGVSDILLLKEGILHAIEVKTDKGMLSFDQKQFQDDVEAHGGIYLITHSIDDVVAIGL
jgi:hypothetical protein